MVQLHTSPRDRSGTWHQYAGHCASLQLNLEGGNLVIFSVFSGTYLVANLSRAPLYTEGNVHSSCLGSLWAGGNVVKTFLQTLLRRRATGEEGPATELQPGIYTLSLSFSHELSVPGTNPSTPIALCTGRRCAAIQRPLEDGRSYNCEKMVCISCIIRATILRCERHYTC